MSDHKHKFTNSNNFLCDFLTPWIVAFYSEFIVGQPSQKVRFKITLKVNEKLNSCFLSIEHK